MTRALFLAIAVHAYAADSSWIDASNRIATDYARADGALYPERASAAGLREFDAAALPMEKDQNARELDFLRDWNKRLHDEESQATDENLKLDLRILRDRLRLRREEIELEEKHGVVSFLPGTRFVLESLLALVNGQSDATRRASAVDRFHRYVNGDDAHPPLLTAFENRALADELRFQKKRLLPVRAEVEQYLAESPSYTSGVKQLLAQAGKPGWESDFARFEEETKAYDDFVRSHVLPESRKSFRLPEELYAQSLRMRGIEESPEALIKSARKEYQELRKEFREKAREVAKEQGFKFTDPARVIRELKSRQVLKPEEVKPLYEASARELDEILRRENLVSLPASPLRIRVAGDAESVANPIPHLAEPPLVNNHGERPEFVVPSFTAGANALDDFSYASAALVLTAHEGRPGHDLQFSSMLDHGTSIIRARYAFNNANVEGWGLYAEEMVYPYLPHAAQLVALQMRLLRVARAYFDPEVQLGKIRPREVTSALTRELGISDALAALELRRFEYENPGQAPSYFYGLERMESAKRRVASSLGSHYSDHCFHDGVLALGLVPVGLIGGELAKTLRCPAKNQARNEPAPASR
jgi:hypothetical protein